MAEPEWKHPAVDDAIREMTGIDRVKIIVNNQCAFCTTPNLNFANPIEEKEYRISGICASCQREIFKYDE